jgi:uncharacterized protein (TIGR02646 family)
MKKETREMVYKKYNGRCAYCGHNIKYEEMQVDHLVPQVFYVISNMNDTKDDYNNLMPSCKQCNHYKRSLDLELFRTWYLGGLHKRLNKLPQTPTTEKSKKKKDYLLSIAERYGITKDKPFCGKFYFEILDDKP